jgi:hypothetical protein
MKKTIFLFILTLLIFNSLLAATYDKAYRQRCDSIITYYKNLPYGPDAYRAMVKLATKTDIPTALKIIDTLTIKPRGDMFWFYPIMSMYLEGEKNMPAAYKAKLRQALKNYTPFRGDTENHWVMYYASLYLAAQSWPNEPGPTWFNGKSSTENIKDAEGWLYHWMNLTTTIGQGEFDSPAYMTFYLTPMFMLYQHAQDPLMKKKAEIMINWLLADFFIDYLDGVYCGPHSRLYEYDILDKRRSMMTKTAAFFLGDRPLFDGKGQPVNFIGNCLVYALSDYKLPDILYRIATDRTVSYESLERKRSRNRVRYYDERNPVVDKYDYMTAEYSLGSIQWGHTEQILQHTWALNWRADKPGEVTTLFTLHPYYSERDMCSLFTSLRSTIVADVVGSKTTYDKEDKMVGSSPYEKLFQYKGTLIGLYDLGSPDVTYRHYDGFFSKDLLERKEDKSGWIVCRTPHVYFAFLPLQPYQWIEEKQAWRLRSSEIKNGFILQAKQPAEMASFAAFEKAVTSTKVERIDLNRDPHIRYTNMDGQIMEFSYSGTRLRNGKVDDPKSYPLFESPYIKSAVGSGKMFLEYKNQKMVLDLANAVLQISK